MAYLGNSPVLSQQEYRNIDNISGSFNGVTTSFPLLVNGVAPVPAPQSSNQCLISVNGVVQKPDDTGASGFRLSGGNIVFSAAPTGGQSFFGVILAGADYVYSGSNFPDGTVSAPSITFAQDLDTGFYRSGAGEVKFTANGANVVTLSANNLTAPSFIPTSSTVPTNGVYLPSANNVAISTNGVQRLLISSTGAITGSSTITAGGTIEALQTFQSSSGTDVVLNANGANRDAIFKVNGTELMRLQGSTGRLGLGTSSPSYKFHLARTDAAGDYAYMGASSDNGARGLIFSSADSGAFLGAIHRIRASSGSGELRLGTSSSDALTIDSSQRVGIGTGSPQVLNHLSTSTDTQLRIESTSASSTNEAAVQLIRGSNQSAIKNKAGGLEFFVQGLTNEVARFDVSGRLGIGTTSPAALLHLVTSSSGECFRAANGSDAARLHFYTANTGSQLQSQNSNLLLNAYDNYSLVLATNNSERARIDTSGRLLVGTSSVSGQEAGRFVVNNNSSVTSQAAVYVRGNANSQGTATKFTIVRHCPLIVLGTKLKIPFVSQGNLNSNTICKVWGHGARYNTRDGLPFEITFGVGHLTVLSNLYSWGGGGNYASIALSGMNVEITFTTAYSSSTADGVFVCIEYMTNAPDYSIDIANIAMN